MYVCTLYKKEVTRRGPCRHKTIRQRQFSYMTSSQTTGEIFHDNLRDQRVYEKGANEVGTNNQTPPGISGSGSD